MNLILFLFLFSSFFHIISLCSGSWSDSCVECYFMIVNMWESNLIHYVKGFLLIVFCSLWNSARYHRRKYILQYTIHYFLHTFLPIFCNSYLCMLVYTYVVCLHYCEWVRACWVIIVSVFESICILKSLYSWVCLKLILSIVDLHDLVSFLFLFLLYPTNSL